MDSGISYFLSHLIVCLMMSNATFNNISVISEFSGILPLKSKIRINVIPSPGFKLVVLIVFRDDSWVFLNIFLNGHNIKRVHFYVLN